MENEAVDYERLKAETLAEIEAMYDNPAVIASIRRTLPNTAEETDYAVWGECFRDTLQRHEPVVREWAAAAV